MEDFEEKLDELLIKVYNLGFSDELWGRNSVKLILKAYDAGMSQAIIGDDIPSSDYESAEEILNKIKNL
jgi:hypothetical protein